MDDIQNKLLLRMELSRLIIVRELDMITDAEKQRLNDLLAEHADLRLFYEKLHLEKLMQKDVDVSVEKAWSVFEKRHLISGVRHRTTWIVYAAVACVVLTLGIGLLLFHSSKVEQSEMIAIPAKSMVARLTLENGQVVVLDSLPKKPLQLSAGMAVQPREGEISYTTLAKNAFKTTEYHTIEVPKYGEYRVCFADGTEVKMNAESSLRYPVTFADTLREVWLSGEAYFKVSKEAGCRFLVHTDRADIEVLGTEFNVSAYSGRAEMSATLVSGSIRIGNDQVSKLITPGQQAIVTSKTICVQNVNLRVATAWTRGMFYFDEIRLEEIMDQLADWYDVDIFYQRQELKDRKFSIEVKKYAAIDAVLSMIEETNVVKFKKEGRTIIIH